MLNEIYFGIIEQHVYCVDEGELIDEDCLELFRDIEYSFDMYEEVHRLETFFSINFVLFLLIVDQFD